MAVDPDRLNAFVGKFVNDLGASMQGPSILVGEQLGLYQALAVGGPMSSEELAVKTGTKERYLREWLAGQAASGYVEYDAATKRYHMTPEQKFTLTDENGPAYLPGAFYLVSSAYKDQRKIAEAIRTAGGSAGTSATSTCSMAPGGSSDPGTSRTSSAHGSPTSTGSSPSSRPEPRSRTSGAGSALPRS